MNIEVGTGLSNIIFGMTEDEIIAILGKPDRIITYREDGEEFLHNSLKLKLFFGFEEDNRLYSIEVFKKEVTFLSTEVIGLPLEKLLSFMSDNGYKKYMELLNKGVEMVFIDNPTLNTEYIKSMQNSADKMKEENIIGGMTLEFVIRLLLVTELDRAEKEREITVKRITDGIKASSKKSGRKTGQLDKMTPELQKDIEKFLTDRSIRQIDLMNKYHISRNTLKKYIEYIAKKNRI